MADEIFQKAWAHYLDLLNELAGNPGPQKGVLQPFNLAQLMSYSPTAENYNTFLMLRACDFVAPTLPTHDNTAQFGKDQPSFPDALTDAYREFLAELDELVLEAIDPTDKPEYDRLQRKFEEAQTRFSDYVSFVDDEWRRYISQHPEIPDNERAAERRIWERDRSYSGQKDRLQRAVRTQSSRINAFLRQNTPREFAVIIDAKSYFEDPGYQITLPSFPVFDSPAKKDLWDPFHAQNPVIALDEFLKNDNVVSRTRETTDTNYSRVETNWGVKGSARWGLWSGGGSANGREMEEVTRKSEFTFEVGFKRFQEVPIYRSRWYQDGLFGTVGKQFRRYWGPNGRLAAIPYSLLIGRGTVLKIRISNEFKRTLEKYFQAGGEVSWGGFFTAGGNYSRDEKYMTYHSDANGFTLQDNEKTVRLLGARVRRFNWQQTVVDEYYRDFSDEELKKASEAAKELADERRSRSGRK